MSAYGCGISMHVLVCTIPGFLDTWDTPVWHCDPGCVCWEECVPARGCPEVWYVGKGCAWNWVGLCALCIWGDMTG